MDISGCDMITIEILTYVLNMIKSRNNNQKLKLIIGGSGITDFVEFVSIYIMFDYLLCTCINSLIFNFYNLISERRNRTHKESLCTP